MHPLKALQDIIAPRAEMLSGVVVSSSSGLLIIATPQGRRSIASEARIPPGTQVTISGESVTVSPSKIIRYPV